MRPSTAKESTNNHAADLIDERIERIYHGRSSTLENVRREGPSSVRANLYLDTRRGLKEEATCTLCWRVASPARTSWTTDASSPTTTLYGAGGDTTIAAHTTRHCKRVYVYHTLQHPENSCHRTNTYHQEACYTTFYSRQPAEEENKTEKKGKRKVERVPQSQTAALPRYQEEEETDKSKQAQIEQTHEKHQD